MPQNSDERTPDTAPLLEYAHAAARRLLATEAEVLAMPKEQVDWFMGKPGHSDAFDLARFVLSLKQPTQIDAHEFVKAVDCCAICGRSERSHK